MRVPCPPAAAAAAAVGLLVACREPISSTKALQPSYAVGASGACSASPTVVVTDAAGLTAALSVAHPGDVVALNGMIAVTSDVTVASSCDGDGVGDPNIISGPGRALRDAPFTKPPETAAKGSSQRR